MQNLQNNKKIIMFQLRVAFLSTALVKGEFVGTSNFCDNK